MKNYLFENWNKDKKALSNDVYLNNEKSIICKKYLVNKFSQYYGNQEQKIIPYLKDLNLLKKGNDYICLEYIDHEGFSTENATEEQIISIAKKIKELHNSINIKEVDDVYEPKFKETWKWLSRQKSIPNYLDEDKIYEKAMSIIKKNLVLANNDIVDGNVLFTDEGDVIIIDYEYGGINNKYFDIASFVVKRKLSKELEKVFLDEYFKDEKFNEDYYKISINFFAIFWSKWSWYKFDSTKKNVYKDIAEWLYERRIEDDKTIEEDLNI